MVLRETGVVADRGESWSILYPVVRLKVYAVIAALQRQDARPARWRLKVGGNLVRRLYSYFSAMTGIIVAARNAGYNPEIIPMMVEKINVKSGSQAGVYTATLGGAPPC